MLRVLFADDQIPADSIPTEDIRSVLRERHPEWNPGFINAFVVMRQVVNVLRDGYHVTVADSVGAAMQLINEEHFDIAIVDLGWWADPAVPPAHKGTAGWAITDAIEAADALRPDCVPTAQIVYSARFVDHPEISVRASKAGRLPFFKPYGERYSIPSLEDLDEETGNGVEAATHALHAAVSFIEHLRTVMIGSVEERQRRSDARAVRDAVVDGWRQSVERERKWDLLTRSFVTVGVLLVVLGALCAFFWRVEVAVVTAVSGIVTSLIPKLLYGQLLETRTEIGRCRDEIMKYLNSQRS